MGYHPFSTSLRQIVLSVDSTAQQVKCSGQKKLLVLSLKSFAVADLSRYTAQPSVRAQPKAYLLAFMIKLCKTTARSSLDASVVYRCCSLAIDKEFMDLKTASKGQ